MEKQTTINGYLIELDTDIDGEGTTQCMISKGRYSASLAAPDWYALAHMATRRLSRAMYGLNYWQNLPGTRDIHTNGGPGQTLQHIAWQVLIMNQSLLMRAY